jgi:hypothetical protein
MERFESISVRESPWAQSCADRPEGSGAALQQARLADADARGGQAQGVRDREGEVVTSFLIPIRRVREDALPENIHYEDTGCEAAPRCLDCPLLRCRYDEPGGLRGLLNRDRDRRIAELGSTSGGRVPVDELAGRFGLSRRTVFRILAKGRRRRAPVRSGAVGLRSEAPA